MDYIPAFTVMIVDIAIKAWCPRIKGEEFLDTVTGQKKSRDEKDLSPVMKQYGMAISDMKIANGSLYSCAGKSSSLFF
jgi:ornithine cyclodeaminase/alanine dehydrogenase-like protein (mu-crystallin family)